MANTEGQKQFHDTLKQMVTLNTAAIGLVIAFIEKLFLRPEWKWLIPVALLLLAISLFVAITGMLFQSMLTTVSEHVEIPAKESRRRMKMMTRFVFVCLYFFLLGIISVGTFFAKNYLLN